MPKKPARTTTASASATHRSTQQRGAIDQVLARADRPLTPQEVLQSAQQYAPGLGIATVYRALRDGMAEHTVHLVDVPGATPRYERASLGHHHHFHCLACDRLFEVAGCPGDFARLTPSGFELTGHDLVLMGRCAACAKARTPVPVDVRCGAHKH
jgi:Fur family transcriptional regulator, ferric uptake regulator